MGRTKGSDHRGTHAYVPEVCGAFNDHNMELGVPFNKHSLYSYSCDTALLTNTGSLYETTHRQVNSLLTNLLNQTCTYSNVRQKTQNALPVCINVVQGSRGAPRPSTMAVTIHNGAIVNPNHECEMNWIGLGGCCYELNNGSNECEEALVAETSMCSAVDMQTLSLSLPKDTCIKVKEPVEQVAMMKCGKGQYTCGKGECVSDWLVHDGDKDCLDGTDGSNMNSICHMSK